MANYTYKFREQYTPSNTEGIAMPNLQGGSEILKICQNCNRASRLDKFSSDNGMCQDCLKINKKFAGRVCAWCRKPYGEFSLLLSLYFAKTDTIFCSKECKDNYGYDKQSIPGPSMKEDRNLIFTSNPIIYYELPASNEYYSVPEYLQLNQPPRDTLYYAIRDAANSMKILPVQPAYMIGNTYYIHESIWMAFAGYLGAQNVTLKPLTQDVIDDFQKASKAKQQLIEFRLAEQQRKKTEEARVRDEADKRKREEELVLSADRDEWDGQYMDYDYDNERTIFSDPPKADVIKEEPEKELPLDEGVRKLGI